LAALMDVETYLNCKTERAKNLKRTKKVSKEQTVKNKKKKK
jgi:hypothetical protein